MQRADVADGFVALAHRLKPLPGKNVFHVAERLDKRNDFYSKLFRQFQEIYDCAAVVGCFAPQFMIFPGISVFPFNQHGVYPEFGQQVEDLQQAFRGGRQALEVKVYTSYADNRFLRAEYLHIVSSLFYNVFNFSKYFLTG